MKTEKNYSIGLDIGTGSVGWCVTDEENNILKRNKRNMWGARLFPTASTAAQTRVFRSTRRRLDRRRERINILQSLILEDMEKEYPNFFQMLRESSNIPEDKRISESLEGITYNLFTEKNFTDRTYFSKFPTIYHLRKHLIDTTEKVDIRLVYLAIHHIIKYRGNFLYDNDFANNTNEVEESLDDIIKYINEIGIDLKEEKEKIVKILVNKSISKSNKKDELINCFDYIKEEKSIISNVIQAILGYSFDITKIFEVNNIDKEKISFSKDIENEEEIKSILNENVRVYEALKTVYSWYTLQNILNGKQYISEAYIEKYNKYGKDLKLLKNTYKIYFPEQYNDMFRIYKENNYVAYNGKNSGKTCKKCEVDKFFANLKKKIKELPDEYEYKNKILEDLENNNFLKKLNVVENGAIPYQLHRKELEKILENQSKYYKTLEANKDNILKLFSFRIPYFVGPLANGKSKWSWIIRKSNEKIRPWNFSEVVDEDATAEEFIKRMTNKCTYILSEDVIPKQSLLYSKFCVLNELNNIRINDKYLSKDTKQLIINKLFKEKKKVTKKMIIDLLKLDGIKVESITGLSDDNSFTSNMSSYIDMKKILGKVDEENFEKCENIIYWITVFEEKKILRRKIQKEYKDLSEAQVNELVRLKYSGWSRLSKRLLIGLKSYDNENIMEKLEKTRLNFMQIINEKSFGFKEQLEKLMPKEDKNITYKDIAEIPTSPANKRAIWQSICIVNEITKIMKKDPKNIFIEFARSEDTNHTMKDKRIDKLLKIYNEIESQVKELKEYDPQVYKELKKHQSDKTLTEKMYLYFIQNGKCLYSGKPLDIDELDKYEVDHIIPRSYKFIDGFDNKALVIKAENQRKKDNLLLEDYIIDSRQTWWKSLLDNGLISQTKYFRLIKRKMFETVDETSKFIERQLVETRQITKYVTNLLANQYNDTNIFSLRAELTHGFRNKYRIYKNRNINNYHHAQDAYILSVIGNILNNEWHGLEIFKYNEYIKNYLKDEKSKSEKYGMILGFVSKRLDIEKLKNVMNYKDCFISTMLEEGTGEFYKQTLYSPKDKPVIQLKQDKPANKYGGYTGEEKAYYVIFEYINKKGRQEYQLVGIPIQVSYLIKNKKLTEEEYIKNKYLKNQEYEEFKIIRNKILKNQEYLDENNEKMKFCSDSEIRVSQELIVNEKMSELIYLMNQEERKLDDEQKEKVVKGYSYMFNYLLEKLSIQYKIFKSTYEKLNAKREYFEKLDEKAKKSTINGLISLMETGQGNLKEMGLQEREGRRGNQTFKTEKLLKMTFIDKSVTGMYERRFKINGMENSCSK